MFITLITALMLLKPAVGTVINLHINIKFSDHKNLRIEVIFQMPRSRIILTLKARNDQVGIKVSHSLTETFEELSSSKIFSRK